MYPVIRMAKEIAIHRNAPRLGLFDTHVSHHVCWPQDIDLWVELNNGRTLTLYDLGRIVLFQRIGAREVMRARGWGGTVAGSSIRYRRRVRMFDRIEMRSRIAGWDARFLYVDQSMWKGETCTSQVLLRSAITSRAGLVTMAEVEAAFDAKSPPLPAWIAAWIAAEAERPWPPMPAPA
ncbi:acyl-CoA thioesterase FadM [Palleronia aestuarii]|uniref:Acyl-CoA thioesterase FadM n=1 Tax=Palleronia aestuarii TaxID=568105 RepID=A0A2W7NHU7_9RHOB|nr:acyl-CoA thioesterase [Palleronia aestuarii]PZX19023.1 acyl-CoA thioesterase FadM [Palleronia aestuarii]